MDVNFLWHRQLALREIGDRSAGIGAMLPDVWRMAERRARIGRALAGGTGLVAGVTHHRDVDAWFHTSHAFVSGERDTANAFRAWCDGPRALPKLGLFAHVAWEMCLDGALLLRTPFERTLHELRADLACVERDALHAVARACVPAAIDRTRFDARVAEILRELAAGPWIAGYRDGAGLALRLAGVRVRFGLAPPDEPQRHALARLLDARLEAACAAIDALQCERADHLRAEGAA